MEKCVQRKEVNIAICLKIKLEKTGLDITTFFDKIKNKT